MIIRIIAVLCIWLLTSTAHAEQVRPECLLWEGERVADCLPVSHESPLMQRASSVQTLPRPVPSQTRYQAGDALRVTIPEAPAGITQYVGLVIPDFESLLLVTDVNQVALFEGTLWPWAGTGNTVLELPDVADLPLGTYTVILLQIPSGEEALSDTAQWQLGQTAFVIDDGTLPQSERAAILIHPNGFDRNNNFAFENMSVYVYNTLLRRGFDNDEIYYLSHTPLIDINGDGVPDVNVVKAPITLLEYRQGADIRSSLTTDDVAGAFEWAKAKGPLDHPLYLIFIGQGMPGRLRLDDMHSMLDATEFKAMLDDYQQATGNTVIVVLEACYSGTLIPDLAASNRIIITSTGDSPAFYAENGFGSFIRWFFSELRIGKSFYEAFRFASETFQEYGSLFDRQIPQLDDDGDGIPNHLDGDFARQFYLNGNFSPL